MAFARASVAGVLRVSMSDGTSVEFTITPGDNLEVTDPLAAQAIAAQVAYGALTAVASRPGRVDHVVDSKQRTPRADTPKDRQRG
jgi:hypothetical protein